jgi:hypothetical protein
MFSYTLTDATGEFSDSAVVTIVVICAAAPTPSPESADTPAPTYYTGDDLIGVPSTNNLTTAPTAYDGDDLVGVPPEFAAETSSPSPEPTQFTGDDMVGVPQDFNNTQPSVDRPELQDDFAITNQSVPVFIPILDNDIIPQDSTGNMGSPMHGENEATSDGITYTPADHFCGFEKFEYSVTDSTGMYTDTAEVTIEVICVESPTPSPTLFSGDDLIGVPQDFNADTYAPSPEPTEFNGDDMIGVPQDFEQETPSIDRPELNDDFATTNQGEDVIIPILANDKIPNGKISISSSICLLFIVKNLMVL